MERRPQGLTFVGIAMLVAGGLSTCCNAWGMVSVGIQLGTGAMLAHSGTSSEDLGPLVHMQREMAIYTGIPAVLGIAAALFVVAGGGLALAMRPAGRVVAIASICTILFVAVLDSGMSAFASMRMTSLMEGLDPGIATTPSPLGGGGMGGMLLAYGIAMAVVWFVVKLGIYVPCLVYLLRPETKALFAPTDAPTVRGD